MEDNVEIITEVAEIIEEVINTEEIIDSEKEVDNSTSVFEVNTTSIIVILMTILTLLTTSIDPIFFLPIPILIILIIYLIKFDIPFNIRKIGPLIIYIIGIAINVFWGFDSDVEFMSMGLSVSFSLFLLKNYPNLNKLRLTLAVFCAAILHFHLSFIFLLVYEGW